MNRFFASVVLLLEFALPSIVGGGQLPNEIIQERLNQYNTSLVIKRAIVKKEKIEEQKIANRKKELRSIKYRMERYFKSFNRNLYWNKYTRVISKLESNHRYGITNKYGYLGRYQISHKYINHFGFDGTSEEFLKDELGQEVVMANYTYNNIKAIKKQNLDRYVGRRINGIDITIFGMMASAHLVGIKSLKEYLRSNGKIISKDGNDTSIEKYMEIFS